MAVATTACGSCHTSSKLSVRTSEFKNIAMKDHTSIPSNFYNTRSLDGLSSLMFRGDMIDDEI
tara:strand:- start:262 stop:450 length:189 start_codon:yes stop_codon:yes gene_type:complete